MAPLRRLRFTGLRLLLPLAVGLGGACGDDGAVPSGTTSGSSVGDGSGGDTVAQTSGASTSAEVSTGGGDTTEADVTSEEGSSSGGPPPVMLPTPCAETSMVYVDETSSEPNDVPEMATDLCTIDTAGSWHATADIGGDDVIDHFVFHSAGDSGVVPLLLDPCFGIDVEVTILQENDGELVLLWSASANDASCEGVPQALPAGHDYLLVVSMPRGTALPAGTAYGW